MHGDGHGDCGEGIARSLPKGSVNMQSRAKLSGKVF